MPNGLSLNGCAKALGYSISTLHKHRKNGAFKPLSDGSYNLEAVRAGLLKFTVPNAEHKGKLGPRRKVKVKLDQIDAETLTDIKKLLESEGFDTSGGLTLELVKAVEGIARAHTRMFALAIKRGEYVKLADVQQTGLRIAIGFRRAIENIPARHADIMAAALACDPHALKQEMARVIKETLDGLATTVGPA